jgi:hypothetical protein
LNQQRLSNFKPKFTDQELVTCYFFAMPEGRHHIQEIYDYINHHWADWFPDLPTYQAFNNRLNKLSASFAVIADSLLQEKLQVPDENQTADSLIDSFPVMMARGKKAKKSCRTASQIVSFGYCSSKDIYCYEVKLHNLAICRMKTLPLPATVFLSPASTHDVTALKQANPHIETSQSAYSDGKPIC